MTTKNDQLLKRRDATAMTNAVASLQEYWNTYTKQPGYEKFSAETLIDDALYGLGVAIDKGVFELAGGFELFQEVLRDHLAAKPATECVYCTSRIKRMGDQEHQIERLEAALHRLDQWAQAYPIDVFPEPDFKRAEEVLKAAGMGITAISASNMRHVITKVREIIADVLPPNACAQVTPEAEGRRESSTRSGLDVTCSTLLAGSTPEATE